MAIESISHIWLRPEDYARFREICVDGDQMDDTYEAWRDRVEARLNEFAAQGLHIERVQIDPEKFLAWCNENRRQPDSQARSAYPAHLTMTRVEKSDPGGRA